MTVKLVVYCNADHVIGEYVDTIDEKYPFFCDECDRQGWENDKVNGDYASRITCAECYDSVGYEAEPTDWPCDTYAAVKESL